MVLRMQSDQIHLHEKNLINFDAVITQVANNYAMQILNYGSHERWKFGAKLTKSSTHFPHLQW